ncbi:MAG: transcription termination factor NusA [Planctomycetes bacterium]|nr:transcription termination factor NusA [Planctomycetota bacterium]
MNQDLLRIIDGIARDRNIDREVVLEDLEAAMLSAVRKAYGQDEEAVVTIDRQSGEIRATVQGEPLSMSQLSRIAAQTAKQVMIQKFREAERGSIQEEYLERRGQIVTGRTIRWEGGGMTVDLGRAEAIIPKSEQIPGETHLPDERIRAMVLDVREQGAAVRIILTRTHPDFIRRLFELEVPEVAEKIIEIKALAREAGYRTKVAVHSLDPKVDPVGACVGVRGSRIKNIVDEVAGEKIDIVRWHESSQVLIGYALKPAEVADIALCFELGRATVVVNEDQLSLAIGKRGQNVRLAARLTGWDIDILTPVEFNAGLDVLERALREVEGAGATLLDRILAMGMVSAADVAEVGVEPLVEELQIDEALAEAVVQRCHDEARRSAETPRKSAAAQTAAEDDEDVAAPAEPHESAGEDVAAPAESHESAGEDVPGEAGDTASAEPQA